MERLNKFDFERVKFMEKSLSILGGLNIILRKGYLKVVHSKGAFGYYKGQGFWSSRISK